MKKKTAQCDPFYFHTKARNWDGGGQERDTAMACVRSVFPDAKITPNCVDIYPVRVKIEAQMGSTKVKVWEGRQQDLFRKYAAKRQQTQEKIINNLNELKEDMGMWKNKTLMRHKL